MCSTKALRATSLSAPDLSSTTPPSKICKAAYELASSLIHPVILDHSIRVYLYASALAESKGSAYHTDSAKKDLLFTACILHDVGTGTVFDGANRFEVDSADAAVEHLTNFAVSEKDKNEVWCAIALHTSDGIVQKMGELADMVRKAIEVDFGRTKVEEIEELDKLRLQYEGKYPRMDVEKVLGDAVVEQAIKNPARAPKASWPGILYKWHLENPTWHGVNKAF
jgi:HD superfamily phosphodiesterase